MTIPSTNIGIIDSGVGGLSIAKGICLLLPHENLTYVADNHYAPYGEKSADFIYQRMALITQHLINEGCKAIVIACNTATVNAIDKLRQRFAIPFIGVEPAIKPACEQSVNKSVGILATQATSKNHRFLNLVKTHQNGSQVYIQPCPGLVELIEQGQLTSPACQQLLQQFIEPLLAKNIDSLVLGCTHYPFLTEQILALTEQKVNIIETASPVANQLKNILVQQQLLAPKSQLAQHTFYCSKHTTAYQKLVNQLWRSPVDLQQLDVN